MMVKSDYFKRKVVFYLCHDCLYHGFIAYEDGSFPAYKCIRCGLVHGPLGRVKVPIEYTWPKFGTVEWKI